MWERWVLTCKTTCKYDALGQMSTYLCPFIFFAVVTFIISTVASFHFWCPFFIFIPLILFIIFFLVYCSTIHRMWIHTIHIQYLLHYQSDLIPLWQHSILFHDQKSLGRFQVQLKEWLSTLFLSSPQLTEKHSLEQI